ncbi:DUF2490 domain-containing protein [Flavobacterium sp. RSB2_4_14]|uniref:DUF2490 domain-containing protein n=1 Tax=Flavobacterium sp. RSB2_4_14 TaxID=3447665 RepID=UPI003F2E7A9D
MKRDLYSLLFLVLSYTVLAQSPLEKEVNQKMQTWISLNTVTKFSEHWGFIADAHVRWDGFVEDNNFYFLRSGFSYLPNKTISLTAGYAHMWLAPSNPDWSTYSDENRIYEQVNLNTVVGKVSILQRIRNEQRWQEKIVNDQETNEVRFTNRVRYLVSLNIPVFKKKSLPMLVVSDEIMVHFGKEVVFNTFDQNRFFIGIKQVIDPKLSFDFGYMNVYQQKYSGYQYDMNHTLRLFFYLNNSINVNRHSVSHHSGDE